MSFEVPGTEPEPLPTEIEREIEASAQRFEEKFKCYGLLTVARASGWVDDYRNELRHVARLCRQRENERTIGGHQ